MNEDTDDAQQFVDSNHPVELRNDYGGNAVRSPVTREVCNACRKHVSRCNCGVREKKAAQ